MPYRVDAGEEVLIAKQSGTPVITKMNRTIIFTKEEILASPLEEHHTEGIDRSLVANFPWGFKIARKWEGAENLLSLYAKTVHVVPFGASEKTNVIEVEGSKGKKYSLTLDASGNPVSCSCMGYRFNRDCKHMRSHRKP